MERGIQSDFLSLDIAKVIGAASDHPFIAAFLGLFMTIAILLGLLHEFSILGDCLIVLVRHGKDELQDAWNVVRRLKRELSTWKSEG